MHRWRQRLEWWCHKPKDTCSLTSQPLEAGRNTEGCVSLQHWERAWLCWRHDLGLPASRSGGEDITADVQWLCPWWFAMAALENLYNNSQDCTALNSSYCKISASPGANLWVPDRNWRPYGSRQSHFSISVLLSLSSTFFPLKTFPQRSREYTGRWRMSFACPMSPS